MFRGITRLAGGGLFGSFALGCTVADQADKFREPIPTAADVALATPRDQSAAPSKSAQATSPAPAGYAKYYQFTRDVNDAVDLVTAVVLGSVWLVVHTPPTAIDSHSAVWGPGQGDALSPVVWRLTVTEIAEGEFDYQLDGRPKDSTAEADYLAVLKGHGHGRQSPEHKNGWFTVDNDAAKRLDPTRSHDNGTVKIAHALRTMPATISVEIRPTATPTWTDIRVTHQADRSGAVDISALGDIEDVKDQNLEDIVMHSRWAATGAGRADVQISGGDMPALVKASECWGSSFLRTYYTDNVSYQPTEGTAAACAFAEAAF